MRVGNSSSIGRLIARELRSGNKMKDEQSAPTTRETADHAELARLAEDALIPMPEKRRRSWFNRQNRFRCAFTPAVCSALLSEIAALREALEEAEKDASSWSRCAGEVVTIGESWKERFVQAERQRDELRKALERQCDNMSFVLNRVELHAWADKFSTEIAEDRALLANQGAE